MPNTRQNNSYTNTPTNSNSITNNLRSLIIRREQIRSSLDRFSDFITNTPQIRLSELKLRLERINAYFSEFDIVQSNIEAIDRSQVYERQSFEEQYYSISSLATDMILESEHSNNNNNTSKSNDQKTNNSSSIAHLESISLPKFSGAYEGWRTFFEIFKSLVDENPNLTKLQKLYYLQSCLRGDALNVLQSLEIVESNYDLAIELLVERYENKKVLIHNHIKNIVEVTSIQKESHQSLRKLIDVLTQNFRALQNLKEPVEQWDSLLIFLISNKLDNNTRREWEIFNKAERPKFTDFMQFLKNKCQILETLDTKTLNDKHNTKFEQKPFNKINHISNQNRKSTFVHVSTENSNNVNCSFCKTNTHYTYKCFKLLSFSVQERFNKLINMGICVNCLKTGHNIDSCTGRTCRTCNKRHNSILHDFNFQKPSVRSNVTNNVSSENNTIAACTNTGQVENGSNNPEIQSESVVASVNCVQNYSQITCASQKLKNNCQVLLATAVIYLLDKNKKPIKCRALLDSASQSNLCTRELFNKLGLKSIPIDMPIYGVNQSICNISERIETKIQSIDNLFQTNLSFLVLDQITSNIPQISFDLTKINIPSNITLADPQFNQCQKIDVLLGSEIFFELLNKEQIKLGRNAPIIQNTKLGWVLAGPLHLTATKKQLGANCLLSVDGLEKSVQRFWEIENVDITTNKLTTEELECELLFRETTEQNSTGTYVVKLPFKDNINQLGESYSIAKKLLIQTEKRLLNNSDLRKKYNEFLKEYEDMGHMTLVNPDNDNPNKRYNYLPHHPVFKQSSSTSKVRIVFNASSKTTSGLTLNDTLKTGPKVQNDLFEIILRMRTHPILIIADVEKMYRMVLIHESQRNYQRILWRDNPNKEIGHFNLNTIVYGFASSSFLATRVLNEIGQKCREKYPLISDIIINDFYMDDLITGGNDIQSVITLKNQISDILSQSGFNLRKWLSNDKRVLETDTEINEQFLIKDEQEKTLGLRWNHITDTLSYTFEKKLQSTFYTKRSILSGVAQLFDPLGLISPVIVKAKLILQGMATSARLGRECSKLNN